MFFSDTKTALEWTCYHSGFSDKKSKSDAVNMIGICIGFGIGWFLACRLDVEPPLSFMVITAAFLVVCTLGSLVRILICRDLTSIMPDEGDSFKFEITDKGAIIWHSVMDDNSEEAVQLYRDSFQIRQVTKKSETWYEIVGKPGKRFIEIVKESEMTENEQCYAITDLCLHIRRSALDCTVSNYLDSNCKEK